MEGTASLCQLCNEAVPSLWLCFIQQLGQPQQWELIPKRGICFQSFNDAVNGCHPDVPLLHELLSETAFLDNVPLPTIHLLPGPWVEFIDAIEINSPAITLFLPSSSSSSKYASIGRCFFLWLVLLVLTFEAASLL
jgi:hypothetical protein